MSILDHLLHGPALAAFKAGDEAPEKPVESGNVPVTPITSIPIGGDNWPTEAEFGGYVNGMYCREYAVRTVVDFITRNIASLPFKVYRKDGKGDPQEVDDGALHDLMKRPSRLPGMSRYRFVQHLLQDMLLQDRWLCMLGIDSKGSYTLRRVPSDKYRLQTNSLGEVTSVKFTQHATLNLPDIDLPDPRVVLDVGFIDSLGFGTPVTDVLKPLLAENRAMERYRAKIAQNGAQIPAYVYRPKEMPWPNQEDYDEFVAGLKNSTRNGGLEGFMPTLKDGMEIRTVDNLFKPVDMNDLEARQNINIMVANAFQVSPENVGFRTGTNSNISAYKEKLWNVELLPYIVAFEDALNLTLPEAVGEPDHYIKANLDAKLRGTLESQYQALSTATGRPFMETNEARRILDMRAVDGGDGLTTPLNVAVGGQPSPQDGGRTQNAQQGESPNGKAGEAAAMFNEFRRLYDYDANFRVQWDQMKGNDDET